jgi:hypothetical protein
MASPPKNPSPIPSPRPDDGRQLGLLLDAAKDMLDEEFSRGDRIEAKSRHAFSVAGALFAVVMATTAGVLNALLDESDVHGWVYPVLGGAALASIVALGFALSRTLQVQKLRKADALDPSTIRDYVDWAERGHPAVAKNLIQTYARLLESRREGNGERSEALKAATWFCIAAAAASLVQLAAVFVALIAK